MPVAAELRGDWEMPVYKRKRSLLVTFPRAVSMVVGVQTTNLSREGEASWVGRKVEAGSLRCFCKPDCEAENRSRDVHTFTSFSPTGGSVA